jgi:integrase
MGLYKRGKTWWLSFFHQGRRVSKSTDLTDRRLAEKWAASYRAAVHEFRTNPFNADCTLEAAFTRYIALHVTPNRPASLEKTEMVKRYCFRYFGPTTKLSTLRPRIDEYKAWRRQTVSAATVNREITILHAMCRKALEWEMVARDPLAGHKLEKADNRRTRFIEDAEFYRLVNEAHPDLAPILMMARYTGMRQGEILHLRWADVDLHRGFAHLSRTKSGDSRTVPLSTEIIEMLSKTPLSERQGYIFRHVSRDPTRAIKVPSDGSVPLKRDGWLKEEFDKAVRRAELADFRFHDLRHTWASHAAMRGVDIQTIAAILGHKTIRMTQRYSHLSSPHLKASVELAAPRQRLTATKPLQSMSSVPENDTTRESKTPPFLEGFLKICPQRESNPSPGLERGSPAEADSGPECSSRRKYDPTAN